MPRKKVVGTCHICGTNGQLSYEHVPPEKAFNNRKLVKVGIEKMFSITSTSLPKGKFSQKGMGAYTLCPQCNNNTGSWYANKFIDWCNQCMEILIKTKSAPSLIYIQYMYPLEILKQIAAMFFSCERDRFHLFNQDLVRFVLNKHQRELPEFYRFFIAYNASGLYKIISTVGLLDLGNRKRSIFSEIAFPPFVYVMTTHGDMPPDKRLYEITYFKNYVFNYPKAMEVKLPVLPINTGIPGDYRSIQEVRDKNI
ncbi:MAG: hypothetical protein ACMUJM_18800 [bacterium]